MRRRHESLLIVVAALTSCLLPCMAIAEHRVALLIGNAQYVNTTPLHSAERDIELVAAALKQHGFHSTLVTNLDRDGFEQAVERFIETAPINGTAVVYFRGHLINSASDGEPAKPVLLGIDGNGHGLPLNELMDWLYLHSATAQNVIIVHGSSSHPDRIALREFSEMPVIKQMPPNTWLGDASSKNDVPNFAKRIAFSAESNLGELLQGACNSAITSCETPFLSEAASFAIAPPHVFPIVANAGDQWVAPDGTVFCYCPSGPGIDGFWIGKYEVPQSKWAIPGSRRGIGQRRNLPTIEQSTRDVIDQLAALTREEQKAGRLPADWQYSLPSPQQWEHAARAGSLDERTIDDRELPRHANFADKTLFETGDEYLYAHPTLSDGTAKLAPVGTYLANEWGLHDVYGNVWELTDNGILCGGSWLSLPEYCRADVRKPPLEYPTDFVGLRIAIRRSE